MSRSLLRILLKWPFISIFSIVGVFMLTVWAVGRFLPLLAEHTFDDLTQFKLHIHSNYTQLWNGRIHFKDVTITNPPSFEDPKLALFKELSVTVPLSLQLFTFDDIAELTIDEIGINLQDVDWIIDSNGSANWITLGHQLREAFAKETKPPVVTAATPAPIIPAPIVVQIPPASRSIPFIRVLRIRLGTLHYVSYLNPSTPEKKSITLNYERTFHNIDNMNAVLAAIAGDLFRFELGELAQSIFREFVHPEELTQGLQKITDQLKEIHKESFKDLSRTAKDIFNSFSQ